MSLDLLDREIKTFYAKDEDLVKTYLHIRSLEDANYHGDVVVLNHIIGLIGMIKPKEYSKALRKTDCNETERESIMVAYKLRYNDR